MFDIKLELKQISTIVANGLFNSASSSASSNILNTITSNSSQGSWFDLTTIIVNLNYFILAFCIFNTLVLLFDFYVRYFKMSKEGPFLEHIQHGEASFGKSSNSWITYLPVLGLFIAYLVFEKSNPLNWIIGILFLIVALLKIVWEYSKTPISKVINGEDDSVIGRFFKVVNVFKGDSKKKDAKSGGGGLEVTGGILGEFANQIGGLGAEAVKQTTGVSVKDAPPPAKK